MSVSVSIYLFHIIHSLIVSVTLHTQTHSDTAQQSESIMWTVVWESAMCYFALYFSTGIGERTRRALLLDSVSRQEPFNGLTSQWNLGFFNWPSMLLWNRVYVCLILWTARQVYFAMVSCHMGKIFLAPWSPTNSVLREEHAIANSCVVTAWVYVRLCI